MGSFANSSGGQPRPQRRTCHRATGILATLPGVRLAFAGLLWGGLLLAGHSLLNASEARASVELRGFSTEEMSTLNTGGAVERRFELPHRGTKYLSAVSYGVLDKPCSQARGLWKNPVKHLAKALPATRQVQHVSGGAPFSRLKIEHGNSVVQGGWGALYSVSDDGLTARFWLDPNAPRDVKDVFGYFRLTPWDNQRCLVTAAVAVDPGDGLLASVFRGMIHNYLVRTAARIQRYLKSDEFAG